MAIVQADLTWAKEGGPVQGNKKSTNKFNIVNVSINS